MITTIIDTFNEKFPLAAFAEATILVSTQECSEFTATHFTCRLNAWVSNL